MVNPEKIFRFIRNLDHAVDQLRSISTIEKETFLEDPITNGAAKYYLLTAIEACIDIGNHIISSERYRIPKDYRDIFNVLVENKIIDEPLGSKIRQLADLRNRLVHLYWDIDDELIYGHLGLSVLDIRDYRNQILDFLKHSE